MKKNKYLCTRFANIYPYYNKKFINFMEKIFTLLRGKQLMFFIMTALLMGAVETAKADYSITGEDIFSSSDWKYDTNRWTKYAPGMYDNYTTNPTTTTDVISPKMTSTKVGQRITVSGYRGGYNVSQLKFYVSYDEKNTWEEVGDKGLDLHNTDYPTIGNFTVEFEAKGDYYVKLEVLGIYMTNFAIEEYEVVYTPEMTVYANGSVATSGLTTDFGLVTTAPSYTYYVKNTNRGTLYVEAEANGGYSVNPTKFTLEAGQQQAVTVTAPANGDSEGTLTLTGMYGEEVLSTFTANFKGDVMDKEGKFFEDFVDEYRPVTSSDLPGWDLDLSVTGSTDGFGRLMFYNSTLYEYANTNESKYAITPKLAIKGENDVFYFNAYKRNGSSDALIIVSYSADKESWTSVKSFSSSEFTTNAKTYSFKGIPSGNYYVKFEICDVAIDWVYGFVLAPESESLVLDETVAPEALTAGVQDVELKYTVKEGWNTIVLPFAVDDLNVFGEGAKAYKLTTYNGGALSFEPITALESGMPYVLYVETTAEANGNFKFKGVDITATEPATVGFNDAKFVATYAPMAAGTMTGKYGVVPSTGKIQKGGANATMKGFRAYFELPAGTNGARMIIDGEDVTAISSIITDAENGNAIYNLNGQRVNAATKGVYIINGKKMIIK